MKQDKNKKLFSINDVLKVKELLSEILIGNDKTMTMNVIDNMINDVIDNKKRKCVYCKCPTLGINVSYCDRCLLKDDYSN